jgi:membrane associated rhomboid family serine protease
MKESEFDEDYCWYAFVIAGACIVSFILQQVIPGFTDFLVLNKSAWPEAWRFVSAIFLHADMMHLIYNMFALILFGGILEKIIGSRKFLIAFFATGIFANIISVNYYNSSLGASGAIFGLIGVLVVVRPSLIVWAFNLPMPIAVAGTLWVIGDLIGIFMPSNVANIAHLSGMGLGLILGFFYREAALRHFSEIDSQNHSNKRKVVLDEHSVQRWEDFYMR